MNDNFRKAKAAESENKKKLLAVNPKLDDKPGIYFLIRVDENGINYAYIGQAKQILTRLAQHLSGYQHIDLSIKKHGLYSTDLPYGWRIGFVHCGISELDEMEQYYIKLYAKNGYQLRNKTAGGQGEGKVKINEFKAPKGYRDGILQGKKNLARELSHIAEKHLEISLRDDKKGNKISQAALEKFLLLLNEESYGKEQT